MKRSKHITLDDLPPKYREQAAAQLKTDAGAKNVLDYLDGLEQVLADGPIGKIIWAGSPAAQRLMDAQKAVMEFENSRILRGISGNINRQVNCETANISKAVRAGVRQLDGIRLIRDTIGLEKLPASLQPVAIARLENPEMPLKELGEMMDPPLGKSGIYHRLKKIGDIAERIKEEKSWTTL